MPGLFCLMLCYLGSSMLWEWQDFLYYTVEAIWASISVSAHLILLNYLPLEGHLGWFCLGCCGSCFDDCGRAGISSTYGSCSFEYMPNSALLDQMVTLFQVAIIIHSGRCLKPAPYWVGPSICVFFRDASLLQVFPLCSCLWVLTRWSARRSLASVLVALQ